jgi:hypothetical protein
MSNQTVLEPHLDAALQRFPGGAAELVAVIDVLIRRYGGGSAHIIDQCRIDVALGCDCPVRDAEEMILGMVHLRRMQVTDRLDEPVYLSPQKIGSNRPLMTRRISTTSLPEMISTAMQKTADCPRRVDSRVLEFLESFSEEERESLGIRESDLRAANWVGDRDFFVDSFIDPNTREHITDALSTQGDDARLALVRWGESETFNEEQLAHAAAPETGCTDREFGVNLTNCHDVWEDGHDLALSGTFSLEACSTALGLVDALETGRSDLMVGQDRTAAFGQDQGHMVHCRKTLRNTNAIGSSIGGVPIDTWILVLDYVAMKLMAMIQHCPLNRRRKLVKTPGTPFGYAACDERGALALVALEDDTRSWTELLKVSEPLWGNAPPWIMGMFESYLRDRKIEVNNANLLKAALRLAKRVKRGMRHYLPGSFVYGTQTREVNKLHREAHGVGCSWHTATGLEITQVPWRHSDAVDEDGKLVTHEVETTLWHPGESARIDTGTVNVIPLVDSESDLSFGPCLSFSAESDTKTHIHYNAPYPVVSTHDKETTHIGNCVDVVKRGTEAYIWAHRTNRLQKVMNDHGLLLKTMGPPIDPSEVVGSRLFW